MNLRKISGWALLALIPATFVVLAILAGQVPEMIIGTVLALILSAIAWAGLKLIDSGRKP